MKGGVFCTKWKINRYESQLSTGSKFHPKWRGINPENFIPQPSPQGDGEPPADRHGAKVFKKPGQHAQNSLHVFHRPKWGHSGTHTTALDKHLSRRNSNNSRQQTHQPRFFASSTG